MYQDVRLSVPVIGGFEWAAFIDSDVFGLFLAEIGQFGPDSIQMEHGDLLIEVLGQEVHFFPPSALVFPEIYLRQDLVAEAVRHYETWVTGCASEVYEPPPSARR